MDASPDLPSLELSDPHLKVSTRPGEGLKRVFDIVAVLCIMLIASPIYLLIILALKLTDKGPIFYSHRRVGRNGQSFGCLKFRTMATNGDEILARHLAESPEARLEWQETRKLRNDPRVTSVGRILRKFSLDEVPQLLNVLKGEMSLVGPRPVMAEELVHYGAQKHLYFRVRPGLTGLWQVSGRSSLTYDRRVALDCQYVESWRFSHDIVIMLRTIPVVCSTRGSC